MEYTTTTQIRSIFPEFSAEYFSHLLESTGVTCSEEIKSVILDPLVQPKKVELDGDKGLVEGSSVNFYGPNVSTMGGKSLLRVY